MRAHNALEIKVWEKFWILKVLYEAYKIWGRRAFMCRCECGTERIITLHSLSSWTKSCGCVNKWSMTHWMKWTPMYKKWRYMRERCSAKSPHKRRTYLDRWITVCDEWNDFLRFYEDMKEWFLPELELDRIDNDKWYSKSNCRWVTKSENCKNRRKPLPKPPTE